MSVKEYGINFTQLSRYVPHMLVDSREHMSKFLFGLYDLVKIECNNDMLLKVINISRLVIQAQQVEGHKLREIAKDNKKDRIGNYEYSK